MNTVHFSNHTGYQTSRGPMLTAHDISEIVRGLDERGVLNRCDAVLSGYQGGTDVAEAILGAVALVKARNPAAVYCCDPVIGDVGSGTFVQPGIPELIRDRVVRPPRSSPQQLRAGGADGSQDSAPGRGAAEAARGPEVVLVTSVRHPQAAPDTIGMVL